MTATNIEECIADYEAQGFEVVQRGRIVEPDPSIRHPAFADRAEGFRIGLLGSYGPPTWRSEYENRLFDSEREWVHLRRRRT